MASAGNPTTATLDKLTTAVVDTLTTAPVRRGPVATFEQSFPLGPLDMASLTLVVLISMGVAALMVFLGMKLARLLNVVAVPNKRSSHTIPTPRLGGFGYLIPLTIFLGGILIHPSYLYGVVEAIEPSLTTFFRLALICGSLAFIVGLMDDFIRLPPWFKLLGQIVCAALFIHLGSQIHYTVQSNTMAVGTRRLIPHTTELQGSGFAQVALTPGLILDGHWVESLDGHWIEYVKNLRAFLEGLDGHWAGLGTKLGTLANHIPPHIPPFPVIATVLFIVIFMNAYNFMDGIDGLAGTFLIAVAIGLFAVYIPEAGQNMLGLKAHVGVTMVLAALFVGMSLGFLFYNRPPAKTFLGDCGSQYIGFILATFLIQLTRSAGEPVVRLPYNNRYTSVEWILPDRAYVDFLAVVILIWPFLYDVIYTLFRRLVRLKPIWRAHHEHLYQRLIDRGWSHGRVVLFSLPFYLAHAAIFFLYCWAPDDKMRWTWAGVALAPMVLYTLIVIACELGKGPAPSAATGEAPSPETTTGEEDAEEETPASPDEKTESEEPAPAEGETEEETPEPADGKTEDDTTESTDADAPEKEDADK